MTVDVLRAGLTVTPGLLREELNLSSPATTALAAASKRVSRARSWSAAASSRAQTSASDVAPPV